MVRNAEYFSFRPLHEVSWPIFSGAYVVNRTFLKSSPDTVRRIARALEKAVRFACSDDVQESSLLVMKYTGLSEQVHRRAKLDAFFDWRGGNWTKGGEKITRLQTATTMTDLLRDAGALDQKQEASKALDLDGLFYTLEPGAEERKK